MKRALPFALFALGLALGLVVMGWWRSGGESPAPPAPAAQQPAPLPSPAAGRPAREQVERMLEHMPESGDVADPATSAMQAKPRPGEIDYPLYAKYAALEVADVEHELVAAWDDADEDGPPGPNRAFLLVVERGMRDASLERLVYAYRDAHPDAEHLLVRIFDDEQAVFTPRWEDEGGTRRAGLVAELRRTKQTGRERLTVRGEAVRP